MTSPDRLLPNREGEQPKAPEIKMACDLTEEDIIRIAEKTGGEVFSFGRDAKYMQQTEETARGIAYPHGFSGSIVIDLEDNVRYTPWRHGPSRYIQPGYHSTTPRYSLEHTAVVLREDTVEFVTPRNIGEGDKESIETFRFNASGSYAAYGLATSDIFDEHTQAAAATAKVNLQKASKLRMFAEK